MNWEIITFLGYFVILLGVALIFYFNGSNKNSEDFFLGGRSMALAAITLRGFCL